MPVQAYIPTGRFWDKALSLLNAIKRLGYIPNPLNPRTFNEHILAQKWSFDGDLALATRITDKAHVKDWLAEIEMQHLIVPTVGVFESVEEIGSFCFEGELIAKSTHGSGEAIIRTAKSGKAFSDDDLRTFNAWLSEDYYIRSREPNYKGLEKRIIVEPLLRDETGNPPKDFKVFCVSGAPFAIQVDHGRYTQHTRQLYTAGWQLLDYSMYYPRNPNPIEKPALLRDALQTASELSAGFGFVRVDFYFMPTGLKLGEMTFFPGNGAELFTPKCGDVQLGQLLASVRKPYATA